MSQLELACVPLTTKQIQAAIFLTWCKGSVICPNTKALGPEADMLVLRQNGYVSEFEVKVSRKDYKADFRKLEKHQLLAAGAPACPNKFYYACQDGLIKPEEVPSYAGLLYVIDCWYLNNDGSRYCVREARTVKKAPILHKGKHEDLLRRMAVSLMYKVF